MPDECLNYDKVMKYILAGAGLMLIGYIFYKYQNKSQTASLSNNITPKISQLEEKMQSIQNQLSQNQEQLEGLIQFSKHKIQSSSSQSHQPLMKAQRMESREDARKRQQFFNMA
ncbi:MAG: hypothetical protein PHP08_00180 [Candidatus Dojkabacteria bacterium]|nr:hypothetical protein [Candidatus Dojkabacteria bacterium]